MSGTSKPRSGGQILVDSLRVHGKGSDKYDNVRIGMNGRLDTVQAAVLIEKLNIFPDDSDGLYISFFRVSKNLGEHFDVELIFY